MASEVSGIAKPRPKISTLGLSVTHSGWKRITGHYNFHFHFGNLSPGLVLCGIHWHIDN